MIVYKIDNALGSESRGRKKKQGTAVERVNDQLKLGYIGNVRPYCNSYCNSYCNYCKAFLAAS